MNAYIYQAALLCEECGEAIRAELAQDGKAPDEPNDERTYDSDEYPKGPYADGGGEADCPQHCDGCGEFLENPLTSDGEDYVRESGNSDWMSFYGIRSNEDEDEDIPPMSYHGSIVVGLQMLEIYHPTAYQQMMIPGCGFSVIPDYAMDDQTNQWWLSEYAASVDESIREELQALTCDECGYYVKKGTDCKRCG